MNTITQSIRTKLRPPKKLSEEVADILLAEIDRGIFNPGEKLPSESTLAKDFGVSRTVIREAMARLKSDGVLETQQGRGATVMESHERKSFRIESVAEGHEQHFIDLLELRAILEGDAAALAADRRGKEHLESMQNCLNAMVDEHGKSAKGVDIAAIDFEFHRLVAEAACNPYLLEFVQFIDYKLKAIIREVHRRPQLEKNPPVTGPGTHINIFKAIKKKDAERARLEAVNHIIHAGKRLGIVDKDRKESWESRK